ncbi:MAG: hypothetical protein K9N49_05270 [Candidatus Marinimicrobia bacterium]|nr:hypothetical protein [Candidatus Neomarinimicrobiota bacterium]
MKQEHQVDSGRIRWGRVARGVLLLVLLSGAVGCEDDDDRYPEPPAGQGLLIVDNATSDRLRVYLDGQLEPVTVRRNRWQDYPLDPGVYRLVLNDDDDLGRSYRDDIDILAGRRTILFVDGPDLYSRRYRVSLRFDD